MESRGLFLAVLLTLWKISWTHVYGADLSNCRKSLGMQSGVIPDHAITASSSYDSASVGPSNARIRTERNGGAWCPKPQIARDVYEWIQIDLNELKVITQVETQGRFGNGQGQEYADAYMVEYQRTESGPWMRFRDRKGGEVFLGNSNTYMVEIREINPPIIARSIRIIPHSNHPRTVCMRLELYGCHWRDGVLSYSMPQGERRGNEVDLEDFTYDGQKGPFLSGGLGQLTDGVEGHSNFRLDPDGWGRKGYEWVGWRNDSTDRPNPATVEIVFEFDRVRNFTAVRFHANNMFSKDVRVFRRAVLRFSVGGTVYQEQPIVYDYMRDTLIEFARNVIVSVPARVARFIRVELFFDARWLMISEVRFESEAATGDYSEEYLTSGAVTSISVASGAADDKHRTPSRNSSGLPDTDQFRPVVVDDQLIGIIAGTLVAFVVLLVAIVAFCFVFRRRSNVKYDADKMPVGLIRSPPTYRAAARADVIVTSTPRKTSTNGVAYPVQYGLGGGSSAAMTLLQPPGGAPFEDEDDVIKMAPTPESVDAYKQPHDVIQTRQLPEVPRIPVDSADYLSDTNTSTYAVPELITASMNTPRHAYQTQPSIVPLYRSQQDVNASPAAYPRTLRDVYGPLQGGADDSGFYSVLPAATWNEADASVTEFPRDGLKFLEKLGQGLFGEVHLCEAPASLRPSTASRDDSLQGRTATTASRPSLVAVKVLSKDASSKARADFYQEAKLMSCLRDPNIVAMLGICSHEDPLCVVLEYMKHGDLTHFLQDHIPAESSLGRCGTGPNQPKALSYGCLIYMATQIASGMKYLETLNMVHRDLATRNCLVGHKYTIKISDFGMSRSLFSADYYRVEGKAVLPIRWMAWESVLLGKFSPKSDVWSFAVTLWEVLTFARERPFDALTDEQVIENCGHYYQGVTSQQLVLPQPDNCPREIYDLMVECWNRDHAQRPAFREVHMFLQRKNMGYNPADERRTPSRTAVPYAQA